MDKSWSSPGWECGDDWRAVVTTATHFSFGRYSWKTRHNHQFKCAEEGWPEKSPTIDPFRPHPLVGSTGKRSSKSLHKCWLSVLLLSTYAQGCDEPWRSSTWQNNFGNLCGEKVANVYVAWASFIWCLFCPLTFFSFPSEKFGAKSRLVQGETLFLLLDWSLTCAYDSFKFTR